MKKIIAFAIVILLCIMAVPLQAGAAVSMPVLVVKSFKAEPSPAQPGEVFTLEIVLANQGKKDAENISLTIGEAKSTSKDAEAQTESIKFLPVENGNIIYVDKIKKGEEKAIAVKLASKSDTTPGYYDMNIALKYYYSRLSFDSAAKIGLVLEQKESLVLKGLTYPQKIKLGETATISGNIVNISNASLKAVTVDYAGTDLEKQSEFFGVFEVNNSDTIENTFKPEKAGKADIGITVSYYDNFGKKQEITNKISIDVEETKTTQSVNQGTSSGFLDFIKFLFGLGGQKV